MRRICTAFIVLSTIMMSGLKVSAQVDQESAAELPKIRRPELRDEILQMAKDDQSARHALVSAMNEASNNPSQETAGNAKVDAAKEGGAKEGDAKEGRGASNPFVLTEALHEIMTRVTEIDNRTRARISAIVDEVGWPGKSVVGEEAAHAAWILVQHADADPEFQSRCLALMKNAPAGEVSGKDIAYLTDRTLVNSGKPQLYGTQLNDKFAPSPISDPENVDKRRAEVGLGTLAEYIEKTREVYRNPGK